VLIDSLAACLPPGVDEDKAGAARPVHQLQEAIAGGWGILTHHARKGAGKEGNIGVGAGRGSSAIDGAVSRVVGLSLIYRMQNGVMVPQEADPRRELMSTKRGGATLNLIVRSDASGYWSNEGDAAELKRQERHEQAISSLSESHCGVLAVLEDAAGELTTRQVAEAMGEVFDSSGSGATKLRRTLTRLETLGLIEARKVGVDRVFRARPNTPNKLDFDKDCSDCSDQSYQGVSDVRIGVRICSDGPSEHPEQAEQPSEHPELFGQASEQPSEHPKPVAVTGPNNPNTPIDVMDVRTGQWQPGWQQISTGSGSGRVLCIDPRGQSRQVERKLIRPGLPSRQGSAA
jgi:DNA-binding transcriptional ArsR family regulator